MNGSSTDAKPSTYAFTTGKFLRPGRWDTRASARDFFMGTSTGSPAFRLSVYRGRADGSAPYTFV